MVADEHRVDVAFGRGSVSVYADPELADWEVIRPAFEAALPDPKRRFMHAIDEPVECEPLREIVSPGDRVVIVTSDGTRAVPNRQLIPWIVEALPVPEANVTVLLGNGTHRANTDEEIAGMFGAEVAGRLRIQNHDAYDRSENVYLGTSGCGTDVWLDRAYVEADRRIVVGFIEPHFFAGFSGGPKGVAPGVAGIETIYRLHRSELDRGPEEHVGCARREPPAAGGARSRGALPARFPGERDAERGKGDFGALRRRLSGSASTGVRRGAGGLDGACREAVPGRADVE